MDWKNLLIPSLVTGLLAGISEYIAKQELGYTTALIAAGLAFAIMFLQDLKNKLNKTTKSKGKKKSKLKLFIFQK